MILEPESCCGTHGSPQFGRQAPERWTRRKKLLKMDAEVRNKIIKMIQVLKIIPKVTLAVDDDGSVLCPDCKTRVRTGNGGVQNFLQRHRGTTQCATNKKKKKTQESLEKTRENAKKWFQPQPIVPPTVSVSTLQVLS